MRVLVVDQDSASNLVITRSLRDLCTVDCVTNKGDCLDLLRSNTFEVIVATERLADGSGLELLGQISKKWPSVLRIFAAERQRLQLLRGRLGPFELFQTLAYPIDPEKLVATLELALAAHQADADPSHIQQIELGSEPPPEPVEATTGMDEPVELEQSDEFSEPRFARAGRAEPIQAASADNRASDRGGSVEHRRPGPRMSAAPRARSGSRADLASPTGSAPQVGSPSTGGRNAGDGGAHGAGGARGSRRSGTPRSRGTGSSNRDNNLAAKFPGSGTFGPRPGADQSSSGGSRGGRSRGGSKAAPVRFPPVERNLSPERIPSVEASVARGGGADLSQGAAMARAARSSYDGSSDEFDAKRVVTLLGGGIALVAVVVLLGFKMFGSKNEASKPASVVAHAPEYPVRVTQLVAQTEAAFKADDFKAARVDVDELRRLSPSHPRVAFFERLLTARADAKSAVGARGGSSKKSGSKAGASALAKSDTAAALSPSAATDPVEAAAETSDIAHAGAATPAPVTSSTASSNSDAPSPGPAVLPLETPMGITRPALSAASDIQAQPAVASAPTLTSAPPVASATATSEAAHSPAATSASPRRGAGEPPPVIQEAKLIRRVNPDYPTAAKKEAIVGSVDLEVTVSPQGAVDNVSVIQATPHDMFEKSAVAAVRKWKYDPRFVDGLPSQAHLKVHLDFGPNK